MRIVSFVAIYLSLVSCNSGGDAASFEQLIDSLQVGMTYDEVEKLLGKPVEIIRGGKELIPVGVSYEKLKALNRKQLAAAKDHFLLLTEVFDTTQDLRVWAVPNTIESFGQLLFVTWMYPNQSKVDTHFVWKVTYDTVRTEVIGSTIYYLNYREVPIELYQKYREGSKLYRIRRSGLYTAMVTEKEWLEAIKANDAENVPIPVEEVTHRIAIDLDRKSVEKLKPAEFNKDFYAVDYQYGLMFDASSGRLRKHTFLPVEIRQIWLNGSSL